MQSYLLKRLIFMIFTLWGITVVSFVMLQLAPGSPIEMKFMQDQSGAMGSDREVSKETIERLRKQYHLDKPILVRYGLWLKDIVQLDFGTSFSDNRPVIEKIKERIPVSLTFGITGIIVALLIGVPLGLLAAAKKNTIFDYSITFFSIALYALPSYVLAILLLTFLGGGDFLDLFPIYGIQSDNYSQLSFFGKIFDRLHHFVLPAICYSIGGIAFITQQQRASLLDNFQQDYIRTARAKGVSEKSVLFKHAFRNSLIPTLTILGAMVPGILGASVIIESVFSIPGLGLLAYEALLQRDYPTIMANFTIGAFLSLLGILLSDVLYVIADPRISFGSSK